MVLPIVDALGECRGEKPIAANPLIKRAHQTPDYHFVDGRSLGDFGSCGGTALSRVNVNRPKCLTTGHAEQRRANENVRAGPNEILKYP